MDRKWIAMSQRADLAAVRRAGQSFYGCENEKNKRDNGCENVKFKRNPEKGAGFAGEWGYFLLNLWQKLSIL